MTTKAISTEPRLSNRLNALWLWGLCVAIAAIGITSLVGWVVEIPALTTWMPNTRPISPLTAVLSVLFSVVLGLFIRQPPASIPKPLTFFLADIGLITSLLLWLLHINHIYPSSELLGLPITGTFNTVPLGYPSPITAFCFFWAFLSFFILPTQKTATLWRTELPWVMGGLVSFIGLGILLTYFYGLPLISGTLLIPPKLNSCVVLLLTGIAILSLAYRNHLQQADNEANGLLISLPIYLYIFALFSAGIFIIGFNYYRNIEHQLRKQVENELRAITTLKTTQLDLWRKERLGNAVIYKNSLVPAISQQLIDNYNLSSKNLPIQDWLKEALAYFRLYGYSHAYLLDTQGHAIVSVPEKEAPLDGIMKVAALAAMQTGQISIQDFYKNPDDQQIYLGLIIPFLDKAANNKPLGAIAIRIDPTKFLYPLIESWPTPNSSAETLLVRKEGNEFVYLNRLRFNPTAALKLKLPLSHKVLPAVKAVLGEQGIVDGISYNGTPVIAALQAIPESPWFIITEIDNAGVYAPLKGSLWQTILVLGLLELASLTIILLIWRKQRLGFVQSQFELSELKKIEAKLQLSASVFTHAREGIMITTTAGEIIQVNESFSEISSYSAEEVLGKNPRMFNSGRQSHEFYQTLWHDLTQKGHWYGEIWNRRKNGEVYAVMENISAVYDELGNLTQYVALMSDITKNKEHEFELEHSAHFDPLTNLPNRVLLADRLEQAIAQARRRNETLAVAFIDLDGFKAINDEHGHLAGDQFLVAVAHNLTQVLREVDTLARLGGDEFIALLVGFNESDTSVSLFTRLLAAAAIPVSFDNNLLQVSASMGVTFYPQAEEVDADLLIRQADQAMYQAKLSGKNRFHLFDIALDKLTRSQNETLESVRIALAAGEFELYYQPKVNLRLGKVVGAEALIRWRHPTKGILAPAEFLPLVENHALSVDIGEWVIDTAMTQIESWHKIGLSLPISVNISAKQLQQDGFIECLRQLLKAHPTVKRGDLEMEILETSAMRDLAKASQLIADSREMGILFSLDDFGTGYSSLTYLKRLPINQLKIDQSFVRDMLNDVDDLAIVEGVLALAAAFSLEVIAEGMETNNHGEMLLQLGCDLAQGYGIARPMPATALENWITTWHPDPNWVNRPSFVRADLS